MAKLIYSMIPSLDGYGEASEGDLGTGAGDEEVTLWTNDVLVAARRIYRSVGFTLRDQASHHSFGHNLVGQNWTLRLGEDSTARRAEPAGRPPG